MLSLAFAGLLSFGSFDVVHAAAFPNSSAAVKAAMRDNVVEVRGRPGGGFSPGWRRHARRPLRRRRACWRWRPLRRWRALRRGCLLWPPRSVLGCGCARSKPPAPPLTVPTAPTTIRLSAAITPIPRARTEFAETRSYNLPPADHSARSNQPLLATLRGERKAREAGDAELSAAADKCAATSPAGHLSAQVES